MKRFFALTLIPALALSALALTAPVGSAQAAAIGDVPAAYVLSQLATAAPMTSGYDRALFEHWIDADGDGCDTRQEVLVQESVVPVTIGAGCTVVAGQWYSWYDGATWTNPSDVDIDHFVPLSEAWQSGANVWTADQRRSFANDLQLDVGLEAVTDNINQSKSDRDPASWMPPLPQVACRYATDWVLVKYRWNLTIDTNERDTLNGLLSGDCSNTIVALPAKGGTTATAIPSVLRYGGATRYDAAVAISQQYSPGVPVVYIAKGCDYPDALVAAPAATAEGGPVLLTDPAALPLSVQQEIIRLQPRKIVVVGGEVSVHPAVFTSLQTLAPEVIRLGGPDRYAAARTVVDYVFGVTGVNRIYLTTGSNYPDALSAGAAAGARGGAVLLVNDAASSIDPTTRALIIKLHPNDIAIAGGPNSVSTAIEASLGSLGLPGGYQRLGGADRFEASLNISHETFTTASKVYLATGLNYPDALAGAALAGREHAPLLLVPGACVTPNTAAEIRRLNPQQTIILGGPNSVSPAVESLTVCVPPPPPPVVTPPPVVIPPPPPVVTPPPPPARPPANPGDTVNCTNFSTWQAAQNWFNTYYPYYGDIGRLDQDNDLIACESLPGAP